ncbi:MAG: aspartate ammonia-lyase [archaeon]|nr:aspartate ammonia-lyase [archaeon]MCP8314735.1 aspartate ammonia-lyase [archaeon]MCP8316085.1 aspartate ammonia-lyase [archaeon]MCP8319882.1 aspartate ammonia-lyase [archaeon]
MVHKKRTEKDYLGQKEIPEDAYYGIQTLRAIENFPISGIKAHPEFIKATAIVKKACAEANMMIGDLEPRIAKAIINAADEIIDDKWHDQFLVDVFQAGAGTSHNMNVNEVLANRAIELLGGKKGDYSIVHPNDHVNMAQSTNDVFPTIMRISCLSLVQKLIPEMKNLEEAFNKKAIEFDKVIKPGRTHLEDAAPIRLGQVFNSYASIIAENIERIEKAFVALEDLNIGATAVGTGLNASPEYVRIAIEKLRSYTGFNLRSAKNLIAVTQSMGDFVELSNSLKTLAVDMIKIANDIRLMSSGPVTGLGEINLPAVQPGSSIMPGKVNPVIAEAMNMVAFQVIGNDLTITLASQAGQLELNVMMPVIAFNLIQSLHILKNSIHVFTERLVLGITANEKRCREMVERSPGLALALNPYIGFDATAKVVQEAIATGKTIREVVLERKLLPKDIVDKILDPYAMTEPGKRKLKRS